MLEEEIMETGSAVREFAFLRSSERALAKKYNTTWYRSKEKKGGKSPFGSYILNKKWTLEEEFNNHMMRFQQVKCSEFYLF